MITVYWMDFVVNLIISLLAYSISVALAGYFRAWVAYKCGDDTPKELGFLTLDMLQHIDPIGLVCLLLFDAGWGRYIPVDYRRIYGRFEKLKRFFALYSDTFMFFLLALICQIAVVMLIPGSPYSVIRFMIDVHLSPPQFTSSQVVALCTQYSNSLYALGYFFQGFALVNMLLAALSCVLNTTALIIGELFDPLRTTLTEHLLALGISWMLFFFGIQAVRVLIMEVLIAMSELISNSLLQVVAWIQAIGV